MTGAAAPPEHPPLVRAMLDPAFYPHRPASVELVQTHISWVFLAGEQAWKVKKPVDFGFLDFTTLKKRAVNCRREVSLNRRLAPGLYEGVIPIRREGDAFHPAGRGRLADYAVVMRRVPDDALLVRKLAAGTVTPEMARDLAGHLARFHAAADGGAPVVRDGGRVAVLRRNAEENFAQTAATVGRTISPEDYALVSGYARRFLRERLPLLKRRATGGRIREGHGDLHAEHIGWLDGRPFAMDCIEFNRRFRCADVAADIAFTAMDLERRGHWPLAKEFLDAYLEASSDPEIRALLDYYRCYRAYVRGKVTSFLLDDPGAPAPVKEDAARRARDYFELAAAYARRDAPPLLAILTGLVGTGKSTVADLLLRLGFRVVRSDVLRKKLAGIPVLQPVREEFRAGLYSPETSRRTYDALLAEGRRLLAAGHSVVLDATFSAREGRDAARAVAEAAGARAVTLRTVLDEELVKERLARRLAGGPTASDGRWDIYLAGKAAYEAPGDDERPISLDTSRDREALYADLLAGMYPLERVTSERTG